MIYVIRWVISSAVNWTQRRWLRRTKEHKTEMSLHMAYFSLWIHNLRRHTVMPSFYNVFKVSYNKKHAFMAVGAFFHTKKPQLIDTMILTFPLTLSTWWHDLCSQSPSKHEWYCNHYCHLKELATLMAGSTGLQLNILLPKKTGTKIIQIVWKTVSACLLQLSPK